MRRIRKGKIAFIMLCAFIASILLTLQISQASAGTAGEKLYLQYCAACHQPDGKGVPGFFPPLSDNPVVTSEDPDKIEGYLRSIIFGYHGALTVKGQLYTGTMPPIGYFGHLTDSEILELVNYQRTSWGNAAKPITISHLNMLKKAYEIKEGWTLLTGTKTQCNVFYNTKSMSHLTGNRVRVWIRTSLSPYCQEYEEGIKFLKGLTAEKGYEYSYDYLEINCAKNTFRLIETSHITKDGKIIHTLTQAGYDSVIPAGSIISDLKNAVCK